MTKRGAEVEKGYDTLGKRVSKLSFKILLAESDLLYRLCQSHEVKWEITKKLGDKTGCQPKIGWGMAPPGLSLESPLLHNR